MSENEKKQHQLLQCQACQTLHPIISSDHKSTPDETIQLKNLVEDLANSVLPMVSPKTASTSINKGIQNRGNKAVAKVINIMKSIMEEKLEINFNAAVAKSLNFTSSKKQPRKEKQLVKSRKEIMEEITANDSDNLLASGKSFSQFDRERMASIYYLKRGCKLESNISNTQRK